ncbi:MAG: ribosome small subunit-dependent GTPase A [Clostridiaceae bacterium]|nr:ribosome small subunit-dependent GTPase A [Clostridiaceae bacterium]
MNKQEEGIILCGIGGQYTVDLGTEVLRCRAGGRLRLLSDPPVAGDRVLVERVAGQGYMVALLPRKNALKRPAVANIDRLCILVSAAPPVTDLLTVDKLTVAALAQKIEPVILVAKCDLEPGDDLADIYRKAGFLVLSVSAVSGEGQAELHVLLSRGISAFAGNSGVGKSSLLNALDSSFCLRTGDISRIDRGRHTTRSASLLHLPSGGYAVDTPGFSAFDPFADIRVEPLQLQYLFPEIGKMFGGCRFSDCLHRAEPNCAVRAAAEDGEIPQSRYESYLTLLGELETYPRWQ